MSNNPGYHYLLSLDPGLVRTNPVHVIGGLLRALKLQFINQPGQMARRVSQLLNSLDRMV